MPETISVPGKLMLAGEYAVLQPHGVALAVAVGQVVRARVVPGPAAVTMHAFEQTFTLDVAQRTAPGLLGFAAQALRWLETERGLNLVAGVHLDVAGAIGGFKVGLGTSAAVTVATLRAALAASGQVWPAAEVAMAARAIHGTGQGAGSGYDVTAIAHGGCIAYHRTPDRAIALPWPKGLHGLALFSGQPAPTQAALDKPPMQDVHRSAIDQAARHLLAAWTGPVDGILSALEACDAAFLGAAHDDPDLVPAHVRNLRSVITSHGCIPRGSGAGGGDCVLAFAADPDAIDRLAGTWQARGGHVVARLPADLAPEMP